MSVETMLTLMRVLGSNPISQDVRKALTEQGKEEYGNLSFDAAINFISNWEIENQSKTVEFVNKLDKKNQGFLDVALLKKVVTSSGSEPLTPAETDELVRILTEKGAVNENGVSIAKLCDTLHEV